MSYPGKERRVTASLGNRKIAGHANAARGEPILRIIGLDETATRHINPDLVSARPPEAGRCPGEAPAGKQTSTRGSWIREDR
jgi:hypothetical protein